MRHKFFQRRALALAVLCFAALPVTQGVAHTTSEIPEIIVTTDFRPSKLQSLPASLTVMSAEAIQARAAQHIEDIINLAPNVNFSAGSSRARYFQIRGIGERSQFQEPVNPSVGFIIDDIDFSGIGTGATLFDVEQVEVLRGPQGTRYGANALAGLINIKTKAPGDNFESHIEASLADYATGSLGLAVGGPLVQDNLFGRVAVQRYRSGGFTDNTFLDRDDVNERDELTLRGRLRWLASDDVSVNITAMHIDVDNGYDGFSLDNDRDTRSDEPGRDEQTTSALSIKADWEISDAMQLVGNVSYADSDLLYGYDEDWTYAGFHPDGYTSTDNYERERLTYSAELRLLSGDAGKLFGTSTDWVIGMYHLAKRESLDRERTFNSLFSSDYDTDNTAIYGQLQSALSERLTFTTGLRLEQWEADYKDSSALPPNSPNETLYGGKLGLDYQLTDSQLLYASVSRGYKAGGINNDGQLVGTQASLDFETEYLWNIEVGVKSTWFDRRLQSRVSAFYSKRKDQQVKSSFVIPRDVNDPDSVPEFIDFIANAARGENYGLEAELNWQAGTDLQVFANLGLLRATFDEYLAPATQADPEGLDLSGRDQAHAPHYNFALGGQYDFANGWHARAEVEGKDEFYFSDRHNAQSDSFQLVHLRLGYSTAAWSVALWARNLFDEDYEVRGFGSFGNDPRNGYEVGTYTQLGEPRLVGVTANWDL
ncbi:MAG: TonB-dependent receptor [Pseudomonadales bacterium]